MNYCLPMNYCLFNLFFTTPVHFGDSEVAHSLDTSAMICHADTLFSALCHAAFSIGGKQQVEWLIDAVRQDRLRFSDCMPFDQQHFYLPRPFWLSDKRSDQPGDRKALKRAEWIPASSMKHCLSTFREGTAYDWRNAKNRTSFGKNITVERAAVINGEDANPYAVGAYCFEKNSGLYFILQYQSDDDRHAIEILVEALSYSGIGGKSSSGYGKFTFDDPIFLNDPEDPYYDDTEWLYDALHNESSRYSLLVSAALPATEELDIALEGCNFQLLRRGGFSHPISSKSSPQKKKTQYFFSSGSIFTHRFSGDIFEVGQTDLHTIYRYGKPIFLGVDL